MLPIYVDFDDVLCETARGLLGLLEREYGKRVAFEALTDFDLEVSLGLPKAQFDHFFQLVHRPDELLSYKPIPEALAALDRWTQAGFEIAIVTGRPTTAREVSLEWLAAHQVAYHSFTMVDKYGREKGNGALSMAELTAMEFTLAVEDAPQMAQYLADSMATHVALVDRPWNRSLPAQNGITRVTSWSEIQPGDGRW